MKRGDFLKTLFLASAGVVLGVSKASAGTKKPQRPLSPVSQKTGFLNITGYEAGGKDARERGEWRINKLKESLREAPLETVGQPQNSTHIDDIINGLDKLAARGLKDIVIINSMHGQATLHPTEELMLDNLLLNKKEKDNLHASAVYAAIGEKFKTDPRLANTRLTVAHYSCYGETVLPAWEALPKNSIGIYLSDKDNGTDIDGQYSLFGDGFATLHRIFSDSHSIATRAFSNPDGNPDEFVLDQKMAMAAAILSTGMALKKSKNNVGIFVRGNEQSKAFQPLDCIKPFFEKYDDAEIMKQMEEHKFYFTPDKVKETLAATHEKRDKNAGQISGFELADYRMALIATLMTLKNGDTWLKNTQDFAVSEGVMAPRSTPKP